jgi:hypothetical protein
MKNTGLIGWVVAAVLGGALVGVLIYEEGYNNNGSGTSSQGSLVSAGRASALSLRQQGNGPPPEVAEDVQRILDAKNKAGKDHIPQIPPGQAAPRLDANPQRTCDPSMPPNAFPEWRNNPQNLNQAAAMADQTIVGTVMGAQQGQAYTAQNANEPGGVVETPVQDVTIRVDQTIKGSRRAGGMVTVQRLGDGQGCFRAEGDPPYAQGQQVLLLLENGYGGRPPHPLSPAGRYAVGAGQALLAVEGNPIASEVAGQKLDQVLAKLQAR